MEKQRNPGFGRDPGRIEIDGSHGEGGGQILRTALALSMLGGRPFRLVNIRKGRSRPGLRPQHLASVRAAVAACSGKAEGAVIGSVELRFAPGPIRRSDLRLETGTAGSVALVLQTVLPALLFADGVSRVRLTGGTDVPFSPPWHYLAEVFAPMLARLGAKVSLGIARHGFYPAGGGEVTAEVFPTAGLRPLTLVEGGRLVRVVGISAVGRLPLAIAERQRAAAEAVLRERLGEGVPLHIETRTIPAAGPGTFVMLRAEEEGAFAGFGALGARGKRAEAVGEEAALALADHAATGAPVDPHLADQLVPYLALAEGTSEFATSRVTRHLQTNLWTARHFLPFAFGVEGDEGRPGRVRISRAGSPAGGADRGAGDAGG